MDRRAARPDNRRGSRSGQIHEIARECQFQFLHTSAPLPRKIEFECRITWFQAAIAWWDAQTRALIELHNSGVFRLSFVEEVA